MASLLERGLEREGHVTSVARDGEEGLDYALLRAYDVVILDVMLPKSDGYEVAPAPPRGGIDNASSDADGARCVA